MRHSGGRGGRKRYAKHDDTSRRGCADHALHAARLQAQVAGIQWYRVMLRAPEVEVRPPLQPLADTCAE